MRSGSAPPEIAIRSVLRCLPAVRTTVIHRPSGEATGLVGLQSSAKAAIRVVSLRESESGSWWIVDPQLVARLAGSSHKISQGYFAADGHQVRQPPRARRVRKARLKQSARGDDRRATPVQPQPPDLPIGVTPRLTIPEAKRDEGPAAQLRFIRPGQVPELNVAGPGQGGLPLEGARVRIGHILGATVEEGNPKSTRYRRKSPPT